LCPSNYSIWSRPFPARQKRGEGVKEQEEGRRVIVKVAGIDQGRGDTADSEIR